MLLPPFPWDLWLQGPGLGLEPPAPRGCWNPGVGPGSWMEPGSVLGTFSSFAAVEKEGMRKGFSLPLAWQGREHPGKGPSPALVHRKLLPSAPRRQKSPGRQLEASSTSPAECCSAPAGPVPRCPNRATFPREGLWDTVAVPEHQPLPGAWHKTLRDKEPRLLVLQNPLIPH